jgi:hypothetical protein
MMGSNLPVLAKTFARAIAHQLWTYLDTNQLLPSLGLQSGFQSKHSTKTDVLHVLSDTLAAVDRDDLAALVLWDLSAVFDTADH